MVHQWYIMNPSKTSKLLILKNNTLPLVRVRVPLSAHNIRDLALNTWYNMVQHEKVKYGSRMRKADNVWFFQGIR